MNREDWDKYDPKVKNIIYEVQNFRNFRGKRVEIQYIFHSNDNEFRQVQSNVLQNESTNEYNRQLRTEYFSNLYFNGITKIQIELKSIAEKLIREEINSEERKLLLGRIIFLNDCIEIYTKQKDRERVMLEIERDQYRTDLEKYLKIKTSQLTLEKYYNKN